MGKIFHLLLILFTIITYHSQGQNRIVGRVLNSKKQAITAVSIRINDQLKAITNIKGEFSIKMDNYNNVKLAFSTLGYYDSNIYLNPTTDTITVYLKEKYVEIEEVEIYPENYTHKLLQHCLKNRLDTGYIKREMLCRQSLFLKNKLHRYSEGIFKTCIDISQSQKSKIMLLQKRSVDPNKLSTIDSHAIDLIYRIAIKDILETTYQLYKATIFNPTHQYELVGKIMIAGVPCYQIKFSREGINNELKKGNIYITVEKHLIKRVEIILSSANNKMTYIQEYSNINNMAKVDRIEFVNEIIAPKTIEELPVGKMEIIITNPLPFNEIIKNNFSNSKSKQDLYKHKKNKKSNMNWTEYYNKHQAQLNKEIIILDEIYWN